ncbi:MAG: LLM class flavin-dependent oxidoreductase, partial [Planctomycetota bacterium]
AYGPKALNSAGRMGDGLILQIAEPTICKWLGDQAVAAGETNGRDMSGYRIMAAAPAFFGDMDTCREATRWFPAMVGNHVADIVEKYGTDRDDIPPSLTAYIKDRKGYDYSKHGQSDNPYLDFITDEIIDSFAVLGTPDDHIAKLKELDIEFKGNASTEDLVKLLPPPVEQQQQGDRMQGSTRRVRENVMTKNDSYFTVGQEVTDEEIKKGELEDKYLD